MTIIRPLIYLIFIIVTVPCGLAADPQQLELDTIRTRYQAAVAAATKPLREQYTKDLQALKERAMQLKNLDAAVAIDREIKVISGEAPLARSTEGRYITPTEGRHITSNAATTATLTGTEWTWETKAKKPATIRFASDGKFKSELFQGTYTLTFYPATTVAMTYGSYTATLTFDPTMNSYKGVERTALGNSEIQGRIKK